MIRKIVLILLGTFVTLAATILLAGSVGEAAAATRAGTNPIVIKSYPADAVIIQSYPADALIIPAETSR